MNRRFVYHVFTPLCRFQNLRYLARKLKFLGVHWHVILDADLPLSIVADWIHPIVCPNRPEGWFPGHWYQNYWADRVHIVDADRYIMLSDDDDYEEDFFDKMDAVDGEVLVCSMKRPWDVLLADPENLQVGRIGGEQIMVSGRVLREHRWKESGTGDWDFIASVISKESPVFVPDARVWWNTLDTSKPRDYP